MNPLLAHTLQHIPLCAIFIYHLMSTTHFLLPKYPNAEAILAVVVPPVLPDDHIRGAPSDHSIATHHTLHTAHQPRLYVTRIITHYLNLEKLSSN